MKAIIGALVCVLGVSACAHLKPIFDPAKLCAKEATDETAKQILPQAEQTLLCAAGGPIDQIPDCALTGLESLAETWGEAALECALAKLMNGVSLKAGDPNAGIVKVRAKKALEQRAASHSG